MAWRYADQHSADDGDPALSIDALVGHLRPVVQKGLDRAVPHIDVLGLRCVQQRAAGYPGNDDGLTLAWRDVIRKALDALGEGPNPRAIRLLLGAVPDTHGRTLGERRRIAADALDVLPSTLRKNYESRLLTDLATQVFRQEAEALAADTNLTDADTAPAPSLEEPTDPPARAVLDTETDQYGDIRPAATTLTLPGPSRFGVLLGARRFRREWYLVAPLLGVVVWRRWGIDAMWRYLAVLIILGLGGTITGAVMARSQRAFADRLPRIIALTLSGVLVFGMIATGDDPPPKDPCFGAGVGLGDVPDECKPQADLAANGCPTAANGEPDIALLEDDKRRETIFSDIGSGDPVPVRRAPACIDFDQTYVATIEVTLVLLEGPARGEFTVELDTETAPYTVNNFVYLSRWNYYDSTPLTMHTPVGSDGIEEEHTTLRAEGPSNSGLTGPDPPAYEIENEPPTDQPYYPPMSLVMDNGTRSDTAHGGRFFIVLDDTDTDFLGNDYTLFGQIIDGRDVIQELVDREHPIAQISNITVEER